MATKAAEWWLRPAEEDRWLEASQHLPMIALAAFGVCCWTFVIAARSSKPARLPSITMDVQLYASYVLSLLHGAASLAGGAWLIRNRPAAGVCGPPRLFCFHPYSNVALEAEMGFYAFDLIFGLFKLKRFLVPYGGAEGTLVLLVTALQRVYPCIALPSVLHWWLAANGAAALLWALGAMADSPLNAQQAQQRGSGGGGGGSIGGRDWGAVFVVEMLRATAALFKFFVVMVVAYSVSQWLWHSPLADMRALPHGLEAVTWYYSYLISSALCFMAFVAFKQVQGSVSATRRKLRQYEAAVKGVPASAPGQQAQQQNGNGNGRERGGNGGSGRRAERRSRRTS